MAKFLKNLKKKLRDDSEEEGWYSACDVQFRIGDNYYTCNDCASEDGYAICERCFNNSEHKNHRYRKEKAIADAANCSCGDTDRFVKFTTCNLHLQEETGFNPNSLCNKIINRGDKVYRCQGCTKDDNAILCEECFQYSEHRHHGFRMEIAEETEGHCDCGDATSFTSHPTCQRHLTPAPAVNQGVPVMGIAAGQSQGFSAPTSQGYPGGYLGVPAVDPQVAAWFRSVDTDDSGQIDAGELRQALANSDGTQFSGKACWELVGMFDARQVGTLDMTQFSALFSFVQQKRAMFDSFDTDRTGLLSHDQLAQAFQRMGYRFSPTFVQSLSTKYGAPSGSRGLSLDNFIILTVKVQLLTESFRTRDLEMKGQATLQYEDFLGIAVGAHK